MTRTFVVYVVYHISDMYFGRIYSLDFMELYFETEPYISKNDVDKLCTDYCDYNGKEIKRSINRV